MLHYRYLDTIEPHHISYLVVVSLIAVGRLLKQRPHTIVLDRRGPIDRNCSLAYSLLYIMMNGDFLWRCTFPTNSANSTPMLNQYRAFGERHIVRVRDGIDGRVDADNGH